MTEEDKKQEQTVKDEKVHGPRGDVGEASPGLKLRQMWHEAHFKREDTSDRAHPFRKAWVPQKGSPSLKEFARQLAKDGNQLAKDWLARKLGSMNQKRNEKNVARISLEKQATKAARHKGKKG